MTRIDLTILFARRFKLQWHIEMKNERSVWWHFGRAMWNIGRIQKGVQISRFKFEKYIQYVREAFLVGWWYETSKIAQILRGIMLLKVILYALNMFDCVYSNDCIRLSWRFIARNGFLRWQSVDEKYQIQSFRCPHSSSIDMQLHSCLLSSHRSNTSIDSPCSWWLGSQQQQGAQQ